MIFVGGFLSVVGATIYIGCSDDRQKSFRGQKDKNGLVGVMNKAINFKKVAVFNPL